MVFIESARATPASFGTSARVQEALGGMRDTGGGAEKEAMLMLDDADVAAAAALLPLLPPLLQLLPLLVLLLPSLHVPHRYLRWLVAFDSASSVERSGCRCC